MLLSISLPFQTPVPVLGVAPSELSRRGLAWVVVSSTGRAGRGSLVGSDEEPSGSDCREFVDEGSKRSVDEDCVEIVTGFTVDETGVDSEIDATVVAFGVVGFSEVVVASAVVVVEVVVVAESVLIV